MRFSNNMQLYSISVQKTVVEVKARDNKGMYKGDTSIFW